MEKLLETQILFQGLPDEEEYILGCQFPWAQIDRGFIGLMAANGAFKSRNGHTTEIESRKPTKSLHFETIDEEFKIKSVASTMRKLKEQPLIQSGAFSKDYQKQQEKNVFIGKCKIQNSSFRLPTMPKHRPRDPIIELPNQNPIDILELPKLQKNSLYQLNGTKEKKKQILCLKYRQIQLKKNCIGLGILQKIPNPFGALQNRLRLGPRFIDATKRRSWTEQTRKKVISKIKEKSSVIKEVRMVNESSKQMRKKGESRKKKVKFPIIGEMMAIQGRSHSESKENKSLPRSDGKLLKKAARGTPLKHERKYLKIGEIGEKHYRKRVYEPQFDLRSGKGLYCLEKQQVFS